MTNPALAPRLLPFSLLTCLLFPDAGNAQSVQQVTTVAFEAPSIEREMKYNIILPDGYEASEKRYPVMYLLHGLTSNYTAWARMRVPEAAAAYELIVVMPDAGNSWYLNWSESEEGQKNDFEDYMIQDLIGHVDENYRTVASRSGRAISGLSMGGYGAITLGLRNPDMFCAIGSHSGAISFARDVKRRMLAKDPMRWRDPSTEPNPRIGVEGFSSQAERTPKGKMFARPEDCDQHDPFRLVLQQEKSELPHIYLDCGTEDRLMPASKDFARLLMERDIPFTYGQSPGGHRSPYWAREVSHAMAVQYEILRRNQKSAEDR
ncbi:MAG: alpha/beta hydrolase [Planctomycetota bacterium]|jgi:S-formylglutathione hydrolase FrmB